MPEMTILVGPAKPEYLRELLPPGTEITAGDTKIIWDRKAQVEVDAAKETFEKLTKRGYIAFRAEGKNGEKGEKIKHFDPDAERIIMVPQIQGGC